LRERPLVSLHPSAAVARGDTVVAATLSHEGPSPAPGSPGSSGERPSLEATAVLPLASVGDISFVVSSHGRPDRRIGLAGAVLRIGRAVDNEVVLPDERVSRHHGLITVAHGSLVYRDLASANGSYLRGERVSEVALGPGDELTLGSTSLRVVRG
jgi:hypothetical protein